jgi:branched-chain amino acid transport system permease protein
MNRKMVRYAAAVLLLAVGLLLPTITGGGGTTTLLEQVFTFGAFAMSYDLLLGFTGIISFGHAMFFGTGAYIMGICLVRGNASTLSFVCGAMLAVVVSVMLSLVVAFLSLRMKDTYFAMITLAVGQTFYVLAGSRALQPWTNANDGITVFVPDWLNSDYAIYCLCFLFCVAVAFLLFQFVKSPVGVILKGIRDNESRMVALGHSVFRYKTAAFVISGIVATLAGALFVIAEMFVSTQVFDVSTSINVLLMTIIGGTGTLFGGLLGAAVILIAQSEFSTLAGTYPMFNDYMILFGVLYVLVVLFLPRGILGTILQERGRRRWTTRFLNSNR